MRTPRPGSTAVRLVGGPLPHEARAATSAGHGGASAGLARAAHRDEIRARLSSGTYDTVAAAHALACALLARGEV